MGMSTASLIVGIAGTSLTADEKQVLCHPLVGGVILFTRNFEQISQLLSLTNTLRTLPREHRLLITVDHEGGRVQRFLKDFTKIPPMRVIGQAYDRDPATALAFSEQCGWLIANELISVGIDLTFAPVLDLDRRSSVIGDRAFHAQPQVVVKLANAFVSGLSSAGMRAVGKHFPGHGSVAADSHHEMVRDFRTRDVIFGEDLVPFAQLAKTLSGMMMAHVAYPNFDSKPSGFSEYWIQMVLRQKLGFTGVVFSDDLHMQGAIFGVSLLERAKMAWEAGCDMLLSCNHPAETFSLLYALEREGVLPATAKITTLYPTSDITHNALLEMKNWQEASANIQRFIRNQENV